ncbi:ATP-binding cassette domain-containing protein [Brevibacterium sp. FAM 24638]|uniref:ATP-binding cassette domain-containing protein n=1 Tax=unclassified Brevibacterium TaxID=2614124 RepID=UPI003C7BF51C
MTTAPSPVIVDRLDAEFRTGGARSPVLSDVALELEPGQRLGIVGESGSGKTTLALLLGGLQAENCVVTKGHAEAFGITTATGPQRGLATISQLRSVRRNDLAYIEQNPTAALDPTMKIGRQFALAVHASGQTMGCTEIAQALTAVNIAVPQKVMDSYPHEISGGMAQRVIIALALARRPRLIIADEPTAALDAETRTEVLDLLIDQCREQDISLIWVSHDLPAVRQWCTRAVVVQRGRIVEEGPVDTLFASPQHSYTQSLVNASASTATSHSSVSETPAGVAPALEMDSVSVWLGRGSRRTQILNDISLSIQPGKTLGLIGGSGSGKTTLAKTALGLITTATGRMAVAGHDYKRSRRSLAGRIQAVLQNPAAAFNPRQTVGASVAEPLRVGRRRSSRVERERQVGQLLDQVDLDSDLATRYPHELSGGQLQRAAIARALIVDPEFVVFDEAVSALDVAVRNTVLALIRRLQSEMGFGALFITHELAAAAQISDEIAVISGGSIVESGPTQEIFATPNHPYTIALLETA